MTIQIAPKKYMREEKKYAEPGVGEKAEFNNLDFLDIPGQGQLMKMIYWSKFQI